jgi:2',3'-cyclic-nucleotide 2'-phosphodiesterase (5'-nucleotidase family)
MTPLPFEGLEVDGTLLMSSGSHGKYLGRIDLDSQGRQGRRLQLHT